MYHELEIEWQGAVLDVSCMLPSPCFPRTRLAIVGVYDEHGDNITGELWGSADSAQIRALVEERAYGVARWPVAIVAELRAIAAGAPDERLRLLAHASADTLEEGRPQGPDHGMARQVVTDRRDDERVIVYAQQAAQATFAIINAHGVDLIDRVVLLELRADRDEAFFGALKVSQLLLPGPAARQVWKDIHPIVEWVFMRPSEWTLMPDGVNKRARRMWAKRG